MAALSLVFTFWVSMPVAELESVLNSDEDSLSVLVVDVVELLLENWGCLLCLFQE